ncbi:Na+/H+ antiporter NhaC [Evansella cellulosilytica]|uniref:Na+/H+ antiporter NhaC n=1 Tax=Evansella cellulosilytica (strain ATCC 21833 / DSM 2522 / FERM P-1141 / JCM 9156 / N-4) TaxID=649639 RepID=E6U123_EVAC2|nr:Na+/H+ antiporter NhaC [Evansella cellulosilytica]ADU30335.1 Na+/H+ antiporter NhaC [Evansella cellulosilytica DSM 2522]
MKELRGWEALLIVVMILTIIGVSLIHYEAHPHVPIFIVIVFIIGYGLLKRIPWTSLEDGIVKGVKSGIVPIMIFMLIGVLIAVWMESGTIPTLIAYSLQIVSTEFFLPSIFISTAIVGLSIGSAFTTVSTIGVAFIAVGGILGVPLPMVAGAVISGALVGDKMSPLSDTTNLASSVAKSDLFDHIRHMLWVGVPAFVISLILFVVVGRTNTSIQPERMEDMLTSLHETAIVHPIALLPAVCIIVMAILKKSAIPTMVFGIVVGLVTSVILRGDIAIAEWMTLIQNGYNSGAANEELANILDRGGIQSMMWAVSLLLLTLSMGGLLSVLQVIERLIELIQSAVKSTGRLVLSTVLTGIGINVSLGEQYMSVILTGEAYAKRFKEMGHSGKQLSKVLESGGTVINPLIPYGVSGVFMSSVLGVPVLSYLPFVFFCILCPVIIIIYGFTGVSFSKSNNDRL